MTTALLFDLDGTLVDTDHVHFSALAKVFADHGVPLDFPTYRAAIMGASNVMIAEQFLGHLPFEQGVAELYRKEALYREELAELTPTPGVLHLIEKALGERLPMAVVTNAPRANAELVLKGLGLAEKLGHLVLAEELAHGKPHPLPYLTGLAVTGGTAARSVAFEDSGSGVRAAVAAGIPVIGITTAFGERQLLDLGATMAVKDFTDPRVWAFIEAQRGK